MQIITAKNKQKICKIVYAFGYSVVCGCTIKIVGYLIIFNKSETFYPFDLTNLCLKKWKKRTLT